MTDCALGAVNRARFESDERARCNDGCAGPGTQPARSDNGTCIAYHLGKRNDDGTKKPLE